MDENTGWSREPKQRPGVAVVEAKAFGERCGVAGVALSPSHGVQYFTCARTRGKPYNDPSSKPNPEPTQPHRAHSPPLPPRLPFGACMCMCVGGGGYRPDVVPGEDY